MRILFIIFITLFIQACVSIDQIGESGAQANDKALGVAEWQMCFGASVGSIRRRYAGSPEKLKAWSEMCQGKEIGLFNVPN